MEAVPEDVRVETEVQPPAAAPARDRDEGPDAVFHHLRVGPAEILHEVVPVEPPLVLEGPEYRVPRLQVLPLAERLPPLPHEAAQLLFRHLEVNGKVGELLLEHHPGVPDPPVMVDVTPRLDKPLLVAVFQVPDDGIVGAVEPHRVADRTELPVVPDNPYLLVVEPGMDRVVVRVEMEIPEEEAQDLRLVQVFLHRRADPGKVPFVDHLVGLDVEGPVPPARVEGKIRLLGVDKPFLSLRLIPDVFDDPDLRVADRLDEPECIVLRFPHIDNELVDDRKDRADRLGRREVIFQGIPYEREPADLHRPSPCRIERGRLPLEYAAARETPSVKIPCMHARLFPPCRRLVSSGCGYGLQGSRAQITRVCFPHGWYLAGALDLKSPMVGTPRPAAM